MTCWWTFEWFPVQFLSICAICLQRKHRLSLIKRALSSEVKPHRHTLRVSHNWFSSPSAKLSWPCTCCNLAGMVPGTLLAMRAWRTAPDVLLALRAWRTAPDVSLAMWAWRTAPDVSLAVRAWRTAPASASACFCLTSFWRNGSANPSVISWANQQIIYNKRVELQVTAGHT